jgi:hypothetical protein
MIRLPSQKVKENQELQKIFKNIILLSFPSLNTHFKMRLEANPDNETNPAVSSPMGVQHY